MNFTRPPVLVVGAGPAGLVVALTLLQNGVPVRIINKDLNPRIGQRGPGIKARSFELFNFPDVPEVNDLGKPVPVIRLYKPGTLECMAESLIAPHTEPTPAIPFQSAKMLGQQLLDVILRRHLDKFSCFVEMGTELRSVEQSDEGIMAVLARNGTLETFDTKWVVGANGAKGVTRKQLGLTFLGETRDDVRLVMGDIRLKGVGLDRVYWHQFGSFKRGRVYEVGEDGWQLVIFDTDLDLTKVAQSEEMIFEIIASFVPTEITEWKVNIRMVNKLSEGRGFVVGGTFVHSPIGGQGLDSAVQDAFNLGWKLALRLPVISEMLEMTTTILNQTLEANKLTIPRRPILSMLGINCRFSSIVLDEFAIPGKPINAYGVLDEANLEAGDRAPDAPNMLHVGRGESDVKTLFGLYRPWYHTVLVFAPSHADATPILGALEAYDRSVVRSAVVLPSSASVMSIASPADFVLVDQEGHAYSAYLVEASRTKVFVIRPDGVVGAIVHGAEGVKKYFSKIFLDA
ncbi:monooxygenase [Suillus spraguei]|nr:monooxygenase [Suillus spraguei]